MNSRGVPAFVFALAALGVGTAVLLLATGGGRADHLPYLRYDGAVIYGDWGLYRPGHVYPWVEGPIVIGASRFGTGAYFPTNRNDPGAYRRRPPEKGGPSPQPYFRSWGVQSEAPDSARATVYAPFAPPSVIYAPRFDHDKGGKGGYGKK